jgi:type II secretory pathway component GspD/PulD (secretin)
LKTLALMLLLIAGSASAAEPTVTLDVKDEDVRVVLKEMQKQCGIRNLLIDKEVSGAVALVYFREVPCTTAFRTIFRQFGLTGQVDQNVVHVERRSR